MSDFIIKRKEPLNKSGYIRLRANTWLALDHLATHYKVGKSEIIQQAIDFALANRMEQENDQ